MLNINRRYIMPSTHSKLKINFEFEVSIPDALKALDQQDLLKLIAKALGATVAQGMPRVSAKQLESIGISLIKHHHHIDLTRTDANPIPRALVVEVAPHLLDAEIDQLSQSMMSKASDSPEKTKQPVRRKAHAIVADFRVLDCCVFARLASGQECELPAKLTLNNGAVIIDDGYRSKRIHQDQSAVTVKVKGSSLVFNGLFSGNTISGPVIGVEVKELAQHRDPLIALWLASMA